MSNKNYKNQKENKREEMEGREPTFASAAQSYDTGPTPRAMHGHTGVGTTPYLVISGCTEKRKQNNWEMRIVPSASPG